jgi:MrfA Zn-binding domain
LAHALIRQFSVECGYAAASLKERISSSAPGDEEVMAGMLIYTAAPDSEGTLGGGLVSLGDAANLEQHLNQALEALEICSSDPLCAETQPEQAFLSLHGAACHNCLFLPETSCERGNRYLDRTVLVPTTERTGSAYFRL